MPRLLVSSRIEGRRKNGCVTKTAWTLPTKRKGKEMLGSGMSSLLVTTGLIVNDTVNEKEYRARFCVKVFICNCKSPSKLFPSFSLLFSTYTAHLEQQRRFFSFPLFFSEEMGRETGVWKRHFFPLFSFLFAKSNTFCPGVNFTEMVCVVYSKLAVCTAREGEESDCMIKCAFDEAALPRE